MKLLVIDCSVVAKWMLPEPGRDVAVELLERSSSGEIVLAAPDLVLIEFASLSAKRVRRKDMTASAAVRANEILAGMLPPLFATTPRLPAALDLALRNNMSVWDAVYAVLAEELNGVMVTADMRLFRGGPKDGRIAMLGTV